MSDSEVGGEPAINFVAQYYLVAQHRSYGALRSQGNKQSEQSASRYLIR